MLGYIFLIKKHRNYKTISRTFSADDYTVKSAVAELRKEFPFPEHEVFYIGLTAQHHI